ncbi:hypothetical protein PVT68_16690 [Microbulbifer bruguierae]|uniref:Chromosome partition protein Smc n=1 Tax=Microbulbifer bruguierae TaxID=3029061 RepID=A0ABY8NDA9_9GAMM|nr:hypothetical protein [Microbulbifer bruguierae]WGL16389.1 hypothetical protein PVT68_16690 [Microbulbifer bruguierae]
MSDSEISLIVNAVPATRLPYVKALAESLGIASNQNGPFFEEPPSCFIGCNTSKDGATTLLIYENAESALAAAMDLGVRPEDALEAWEQGIGLLLELYKKSSRNSVLLDLSIVKSDQEDVKVLLETRFQRSIALPSVALLKGVESTELNNLLAAHKVACTDRLIPVLRELELRTSLKGRRGRSMDSLDVDAIYDSLSSIGAGGLAKKEIMELEGNLYLRDQEIELLNKQLHHTQEELEFYYQQLNVYGSDSGRPLLLRLSEQAAQIEQLTSSLQAAHSELDNLRKGGQLPGSLEVTVDTSNQLKLMEAEVNLLTQQLHHTQEELEHYYHQLMEYENSDVQTMSDLIKEKNAKLLGLSRRKKLVEADLQGANAELSNANNELSKANAELSMAKEKLAELESEDKADVLQEKIEEKNLKLQKLSNAKKALLAENVSLIEELEAAREKLNSLQDEIEQMRSSGAWRVISPLKQISSSQRREKHAIKKVIRVIKESMLFDDDWYLNEYPDVAEDGLDPVEHYVRHGADEDRDPNSVFSTSWYKKLHPEVVEAGVNPLFHYISIKRDTKRMTSLRKAN